MSPVERGAVGTCLDLSTRGDAPITAQSTTHIRRARSRVGIPIYPRDCNAVVPVHGGACRDCKAPPTSYRSNYRRHVISARRTMKRRYLSLSRPRVTLGAHEQSRCLEVSKRFVSLYGRPDREMSPREFFAPPEACIRVRPLDLASPHACRSPAMCRILYPIFSQGWVLMT